MALAPDPIIIAGDIEVDRPRPRASWPSLEQVTVGAHSLVRYSAA